MEKSILNDESKIIGYINHINCIVTLKEVNYLVEHCEILYKAILLHIFVITILRKPCKSHWH